MSPGSLALIGWPFRGDLGAVCHGPACAPVSPFLYSHNLYLEAWLEQGILGVLALVWLGIALAWTARRRPAGSHDLPVEGVWFGLAAFYLHGLTDARPYVDVWCWLPFFYLLGLSSAALLQHRKTFTRQFPRNGWLGRAGWLLSCWCCSSTSRIESNLACLKQARADLGPVYGGEGGLQDATMGSFIRLR
jgi:hypothetical protein